MANFYIRQRARVISADLDKVAVVGAETSIVGEGFYLGHPFWELDIPRPKGRRYKVWKINAAECLAPIIPPHEAGQWSVIEALCPSLRDMRELA